MPVSMWGQGRAFFLSVLFGAALGLLYGGVCVLRTLHGVRYGRGLLCRLRISRLPGCPRELLARRVLPPFLQGVLIFLEDLLYFLSLGALSAVFVYWQNDGVFRLYMPIGWALGYILYYGTVGRLLIASAETVAALLRILFFYTVRLPIFLFFRFLRFLLRSTASLLDRFLLLPLYAHAAAGAKLRSARRDLLGYSRNV